ncbi:MAG TPA: L-threonylcarbamoyladenylate synthase [Gemmatimonadaceae bacterium]|nr:L-threonylcarbamoyladenylate synthase [Gemmatimonadaceae bacterium]
MTATRDLIPFGSDADVEKALPTVVTYLQRGGVLAYPTETVYGFGGAPTPEAIDALARLKPRPAGKPYLLLVASLEMIAALGMRLEGDAARLAERHWPGALTLVLPAENDQISGRLRGPEGGVAVRWTSHPGLARLLRAFGHPITSTSANAAGAPPALSASELAREWSAAMARDALRVLDGGILAASPASTMVDCTGRHPRVIRPGAIASATLRQTVPDLIGDV